MGGLLEQFETIRVATYCLRSSSERCDLNKLKEIIEETLPETVVDRCRECACIAKAALDQTTMSQTWGFHERCTPAVPGTEAPQIWRSTSSPDRLNMAKSFEELRASVREELAERMCSEESVRGELAERMCSEETITIDSHSERILTDGEGPEGCTGEVSSSARSVGTGSVATSFVQNVATAAATLEAMNSVMAVRMALKRVEVLLRDEEFMAFGHWGFTPASALEGLRVDAPDKGHFVRRNWHVPLWTERPQRPITPVEQEVFARASELLELHVMQPGGLNSIEEVGMA